MIEPAAFAFRLVVYDAVAPLGPLLLFGLERVDLRNEISQNWGSAARTFGFGFALTNFTVRHEEIGALLTAKLLANGGHYSPTHARYDWLTLNSFADITGADHAGCTLANTDCYFFQSGNSTIGALDTATPQLSPLIGGKLGNGYGVANQDGDTNFLQRFSLQTHDAFDAASAMRFAQQHQHPLVTGTVTGTTPGLPSRRYSFLSVNNPEVLLWALKPSEEGVTHGLIARVWHLGTNGTNFALSLALPVSSAKLSILKMKVKDLRKTTKENQLKNEKKISVLYT